MILLSGSRFLRKTITRNEPFWIMVIMLLAAFLRLPHIAEPSLYLDESFSMWYSQQRLEFLIPAVARDSNPPLHFILLKYWMELFGNDHVAARTLSTIFSTLSIPLLFVLGKRFFHRNIAYFATLWFAISDIHVHYSQEARGYTLVVFLALASVWLLMSWRESASTKTLILWAVVNALLLHTHYATIFLLLGQGAVAIFYLRAIRFRILPLLGGFLLTGLLFLPWFLYFQSQFKEPGSWGAAPDMNYFTWVWLRWLASPSLLWLLPLLAALCLPFWKWKKTGIPLQSIVLCSIIALLIPGLAFVIAQISVPIFKANYLLFVTPFVFLLVGMLIHYTNWKWWLKGLIASVILIFALSKVHPIAHRSVDWPTAVQQSKIELAQNNPVYVAAIHSFHSFAYYFDKEIYHNYRHTLEKLKIAGINFVLDEKSVKRKGLGEKAFLIYPASLKSDSNFSAQSYLQLQAVRVEKQQAGDLIMETFYFEPD